MFLLNGGALIAFPAFAELVNTNLSEQIGMFLISVFAFVAGLVLIMITTVLAYMSFDAEVAAYRELDAVVRLNLVKRKDVESFTEEQEIQRAGADKEREKFGGIARALARWALGLAIGSIMAFIVGAGVAGMVLSS